MRVSCVVSCHLTSPPPPRFADEFAAHVAKYGLKFTAEELVVRKAVFERNVAKINAHNAQAGVTWTQGVNKFTHLTGDE